MVLYVVDVRGGGFAAFSVPWDRTMRNTGATQASLFLPVGGDMIRPPVAQGAGPRKPAAGNAPNPNAPNPNAPANNPAGNNAPGNNANPPKNNQNPNQKNP
jgi:hypothetical protein